VSGWLADFVDATKLLYICLAIYHHGIKKTTHRRAEFSQNTRTGDAVHLLFRYLGLFIDSEAHTSDGRMDAVVQTPTDVFILEFKVDESAESALQQIKTKQYAEKYRLTGKPVTGVGIAFGSGRKDVAGWVSEAV
jgi:PD-(D/E)XK nuclease superfamily